MLLSEIPGLKEARELDSSTRLSEALALGDEVAGVPVRSMTVKDYLLLYAMRSPFVAGGRPKRDDCTRLLVYMHRDYCPPDESRWRHWRAKGRVLKTIARQQTIDLMAAVAMWLEAVVFMDSGASKGEVDEPDYSVAATLINSLAMSYGWTVAEIMSQPMALVMQLGKARADYHGNKRTHWNYHQDAARRRFLDGMTGS